MEIIIKCIILFSLFFMTFSFIATIALLLAAYVCGNYEYSFEDILKDYLAKKSDVLAVAVFCLILTFLTYKFYLT